MEAPSRRFKHSGSRGGRGRGNTHRGCGTVAHTAVSQDNAGDEAAAAIAALQLASTSATNISTAFLPDSNATASAAASTGNQSANPAPVGTLLSMCSEAEARERERCRELSVLEMADDKTARPSAHVTARSHLPIVDLARAVKRYARPSAGAPPPPPSELRPLHVLQSTVSYLLQLWTARIDLPPLTRYAFVADRLRAVQSDMSVQRLDGASASALLRRIARFHAAMEAVFFEMHAPTDAGYSHVHNRTALCNVLISALEPSDTLDLDLHAELVGYFLLMHASAADTIIAQLARTPAQVLACASVQLALRTVAALNRSDFADLERALAATTRLNLACILHAIPAMRISRIRQLNTAYLSRELISTDDVAKYLWIPTGKDAVDFLIAYGLPVENVGVDPPVRKARFHAAHVQLPEKQPWQPLPVFSKDADGAGLASFAMAAAAQRSVDAGDAGWAEAERQLASITPTPIIVTADELPTSTLALMNAVFGSGDFDPALSKRPR